MTTQATHQAKVSTPNDREIRTEREFEAPRERVWQAFTDPQLLARWWGRGNQLDVERFELKPGGEWRFVEHGPEGETGFEGEFREIVPKERISQTFSWDGMKGKPAVDTATFQDAGGGRTKVVSTTRFETREERDAMMKSGMEGGLNESYAALDRVLAR